MSLYDTMAEFKREAKKLPMKYEDYDITVLADAYCDACDENNAENKNIYIAALILRFWNNIDKMYNSVKTFGYEREDLFFKLYELIEVACQYRGWRNPEKHTNAEACIRQIIATRGVPAIVGAANFQKNTHASLSLDEVVSDDGESTFGDTLPDESQNNIFDMAKDMIQSLIKHNRVIEAIIADKMAYADVFKHEKKSHKKEVDGKDFRYYEETSEFWPFKVVQELNSINDDYKRYFESKYTIKADILEKAIEDLQKANNQKKYKMISKSRELMQKVFC